MRVLFIYCSFNTNLYFILSVIFFAVTHFIIYFSLAVFMAIPFRFNSWDLSRSGWLALVLNLKSSVFRFIIYYFLLLSSSILTRRSAEVYSEPNKIASMQRFANIVNALKSPIIFTRSSVFEFRMISGCMSVAFLNCFLNFTSHF